MLHKRSSRRAKCFALKLGTLALFSGAFFTSQAHAQDFISVLNSEGQIFSLDTSSGQTQLVRNYSDVGGIEEFSPNALGYSQGSFFYSTYNVDPNQVSKDGFVLISGGSNANVAAGAAVGDTYYFIDNEGVLRSIEDVFGAPSATIVSPGFTSPPDSEVEGTYGDLEFNGSVGYVSFDNKFGSFDLSDPSGTLDVSSPGIRYLGLAFGASGTLYGISGSSGNYDLYSVDLSNGSGTFIADVVGGGLLTDAAPIPEPGVVIGTVLGLCFLGYSSLRRRRSSQAVSAAA